MTYFSGWLIALCFGVFILYTAIKAIRLRHAEKRRFQGRFWLFVGFLILVQAVLVLIFRRWLAVHGRNVVWPHTITTNILADLAAIGGLILVIQSHRALGRNWSYQVVIQEKHELIQRGPYAYIRHPLYSGLLLMFTGMALYCGRKVCIVVFLYCLFGFYFRAQLEERLLEKTFPAYSEYKRRTKALIPFVW